MVLPAIIQLSVGFDWINGKIENAVKHEIAVCINKDVLMREVRDLRKNLSLLSKEVQEQRLFSGQEGANADFTSWQKTNQELASRVNDIDSAVKALGNKVNDLVGQYTILSMQTETSGLSVDQSDSYVSHEDMEVVLLDLENDSMLSEEIEYFQNLENKFRKEDVDPHWAQVLTDKLERAFQEIDNGMSGMNHTLIDLDCKTTLCRLEVEYPGLQTVDGIELMLSEQFASDLPERASRQPLDGQDQARIVYYMAREGYHLTSILQ